MLDPGGVPFAKIRLGYIQSYDAATHTVTANIGDLLTAVPSIPVLKHVLPVAAQPGMFAEVSKGGTTQYTLLGMLGSGNGGSLTQVLTDVCSANVDLSATEVDITGASVTFTTRANARYFCTGSFYFSSIAASAQVAAGKLSIDGSIQPAVANFTGLNTVPDRVNSSQSWTGTLAAGSHTLKLRGQITTGTPPQTGVRVNAGSTTILVLVFE